MLYHMINNRYHFLSSGYNTNVVDILPDDIIKTPIALKLTTHNTIPDLYYVRVYWTNSYSTVCAITENLTDEDIIILKLKHNVYITEVIDPFANQSVDRFDRVVYPNIPHRHLKEQCHNYFNIK